MTEEDKARVEAWLENNGYTLYADRGEELPVEVVAGLLKGNEDALGDFLCEVEQNAYPYCDFDSHKDDCIAALKLPDDIKEDEDFDETFMENVWIDTSDYLNTLARYTSGVHITATPYTGEPLKPGDRIIFEEDQDERLFLFPHSYCGEEENERRAAKLRDVLGVENPDEAETMYEFDELKMLGTLDIVDLMKNGPPTHITLGPDIDNELLAHNSVNGSGGMGTIKPTKTVTLPAMFAVDNGDRYGVDAVYGFVGEVWAKELPASRVE